MRLAIIAVLLAISMLLVRSLFRSGTEGALGKSTEMVQDPHCKTYVPKPEAVLQTIAGKEFYFCSRKCAEEFQVPSGKGQGSSGSA